MQLSQVLLPQGNNEPISVADVLAAARRHIRADIAFVAEFRGDNEVFRAVDGAGEAVGLCPGHSQPLRGSYCKGIVDGSLPKLIPDARRDERVRDLPVTAALRVGTYLGVPIDLGDGRVYGTLCCISHEADPSIQERDVKLIEILADVIATQLRREEQRGADEQAKRDWVEAVIAGGGPRMVYQPIVELNTGQIVGFESLARFDDIPNRDIASCFAEARDVGLGTELELCALRTALARLPNLAPGLYLSINVSPATLSSEAFFGALGDSDPTRIVVEVTEHDGIDEYQPLMQAINRLKAEGFRLAIDDVGAGYSGLSHIVRVRPGILKLDISLTHGIQRDPAKQALTSAVVTFASRMRMEVIAEGVETEADATALQILGVPYGQGFHFGRPEAAAAPSFA